VAEKCGPYTFSKAVSRQQKKDRNTLDTISGQNQGAFDGVMNQKKGVNTISYKKKEIKVTIPPPDGATLNHSQIKKLTSFLEIFQIFGEIFNMFQ